LKYFVSISSRSTQDFAKTTNSPSIEYFNGSFKIKEKDFIPKEYMDHFYNSDAIVVNGTWGNSLRKELHIPKDFDYGIIGNTYLHYKQRSAVLDVLNSHWVDLAKKHNKKIVVFESRTLSRAENNYRETDHKMHVRVSLDSWVYGDGKWLSPKDFNIPRKINAPRLYDHSWNIKGSGSIYIFTGLETDPTSTMPIGDFLERSIKTIRKNTNRRIKIKIHPASKMSNSYQYLTKKYKNIKFVDIKRDFKELYEDMYCAVINNSTSIFELIDAGIPVYCSDVNFGKDLKNINLNTINSPHLASKEEILNWANEMSCTELPYSYFKNDEILYYTEALIERYS